jgi:exopolysaccharide biosynthesis protein
MPRFVPLLLIALLWCAPLSAQDVPYSGRWWRTVSPGIEEAHYFPPDSGGAHLLVLRIDPAQFSFHAHYTPGEARTLSEWEAALPGAIGIVNAGFFTANYQARGLLIVDGVLHNPPIVGRGGFFTVHEGRVRVRSAVREPYLPDEALDHVVQGFPLLVLDGAMVQVEAPHDWRTRRTVIAQDRWGHILWITTPGSGMTLWDMADYLPRTDLGVQVAVNLDGGSSSLLALHPPDERIGRRIESRAGVPAVLALTAR